MTRQVDDVARSACRWCGRPDILWCITEKGNRIPIEWPANPAGNVELFVADAGGPPLAKVHGQAGESLFGEPATPRYMPHHATCRAIKPAVEQ